MNLKSNQIRLIAFDLDGTLLNAAKVLTQRNKAALEHAAEKGILIVPTTGRLFSFSALRDHDQWRRCVRH